MNFLQSINLDKYNDIQSYFTGFVIFLCLCITFALVLDLSQIHIYRHDAAYYYSMDKYLLNLKSEGRWLNYLLFPLYSAVPGKWATFLDLLFLFIFTLTVCYRWTKSFPYALLLSLLFIQVTPMMAQILWPASIFPALLILFVAVLVSSYLPFYLFYILFGMLLLGSISNIYYLLPLLHLGLLNSPSMRTNLKVLLLRIIPAWALGFVVGYVFLLFMLYMLIGQIGIEISYWRKPNYIDSFHDLEVNILNSFGYLQEHVAKLFSGSWRKEMMVAALMIGFVGANKRQYIPVAILSCAIITVHYIVVIPVGIFIAFRTANITWLGVLVLFFFYPVIKKWQQYLLLPIILFLTFSFYKVNHESLSWYSSVTNMYHDELLRAAPLPPELYNGLILLSSDVEVEKMNSMISSKLDLDRGGIEGLDQEKRLAPAAYEAGFKKVLLCNTSITHSNTEVCKKILANGDYWSTRGGGALGLYRILGQQDGFLVVSLNDKVDL